MRIPEVVLCGYERGGTTLLSEIFRQNGFRSGFEVGVLMCESPKDFENYYPYNKNMIALWDNLDEESFKAACKEQSFESFYTNIFDTSFPRVTVNEKFYDKTPIYMSELGRVLSRTEFVNKAIVITRDPRSVFVSWSKRQVEKNNIEEYIKKNIDVLVRRYLKYFIGCITHRNNPNVKFVSFEDLCLDVHQHLDIIGTFIEGKKWKNFGSEPKYSNVTNKNINIAKLNEYQQFISIETEKLILEKTKLAALFFSTEKVREEYLVSWLSIEEDVRQVLKEYSIVERSLTVEGVYFEPETYLLRHRDVLRKKINPIMHFNRSGKKEGRKPY